MIAVVLIDREHLDNGAFLKSLAVSLSGLRGVKILFVHADSEYTDRVMQLGMMREQALQRSTRELNRRLTALFNDEGNICVGLNGYQRDVVSVRNSRVVTDAKYLRGILEHSHVVLSNLAGGGKVAGGGVASGGSVIAGASVGGKQKAGDSDQQGSEAENLFVPPAELLESVCSALSPDHIIVFSRTETAAAVLADPEPAGKPVNRDDARLKDLVPVEMSGFRGGFLVTGLRRFALLPEVSGMLRVGELAPL
jgi:hypothetical protein